jgi:hypothetical protein
MARRIARGLFRLWIVGSVMWICTVGTVTWWTWTGSGAVMGDWDVVSSKPTPVPDWARDPPQFDPDEYLAFKRKADAPKVAPSIPVPDWARDPSPSDAAPKKPDDELPDAPWLKPVAEGPPPFDQTVPVHGAGAKPAKPSTIQTAAEIALIPPILVLALGAGLGWAFKGFRN